MALLLVLSLVATDGAKADSNSYATEDGFVLWKNSEESIRKEALPAEEDPQGNWGAISYGYQLSVRFEKDTYVVGEPIVATILLRNTTPEPLLIFGTTGTLMDYDFFVVDGQRNGKRVRREHASVSMGPLQLNPRKQYKYQIRLDEHYDFSAKGEFLIYVQRPIPKENQTFSPALRLHLEEAIREYNLRADPKIPIAATQLPVQANTKSEPVAPSPMPEYSLVVSANARIQVVDAPKTAGQALPGKTASTTSSPRAASANAVAPPVVGWTQPSNSYASANATKPKTTANTSATKATPKAAANKTPAQLAQAETGGGFSRRDWVFGLLVLGLVLGLGGLLFRARASRPRS